MRQYSTPTSIPQSYLLYLTIKLSCIKVSAYYSQNISSTFVLNVATVF